MKLQRVSHSTASGLLRPDQKERTLVQLLVTLPPASILSQPGWPPGRWIRRIQLLSSRSTYGRRHRQGPLWRDGRHVAVGRSELSTASVNATIDVTTISTGDANRDGHLKSDDFFDAEQFRPRPSAASGLTAPAVTSSSSFSDLTLRRHHQNDAGCRIRGSGKDPYGLQRSGFTAQTSINRREFGLNWSARA